MEPIAAGFMVLVGTAALIGAVVGAIGGAVSWRVGANLALGSLLTAVALLLVLAAEGGVSSSWLRGRLTWGVPSMAFTFLAASVSARWLATRTTLGRTGTALAAFAVALILGLLSLRLFGLSLRPPMLAASGAGVCLILLVIHDRPRP
jgi:hypothetical protein